MKLDAALIDDPLILNGRILRAISGGSDVEVDDPPTDTPTDDPPADDPPPPDPAAAARAELDRERAERLRLEGENRALKDGAGRRDDKTPTIADQRAAVKADFASGKLSEPEYIEKLTDLRVAEKFADREIQEERNRPVAEAGRRLDGYLEKYPDLNVPNSELLNKVTAELRDLVTLGYDPSDLRTQLIATERVIGGHRMGGGTNGRDFNRQRTPVNGTGGGAGGSTGGGGKKDPLAHVPKAQLEHWKEMGYSREQMEAEAPYVKPRPARGFV